jgi:hypothetical protein
VKIDYIVSYSYFEKNYHGMNDLYDFRNTTQTYQNLESAEKAYENLIAVTKNLSVKLSRRSTNIIDLKEMDKSPELNSSMKEFLGRIE